MNLLIIDADGLVVNVIVCADAAAVAIDGGCTIEPQTGSVWIGWRRVDGAWLPPEEGTSP